MDCRPDAGTSEYLNMGCRAYSGTHALRLAVRALSTDRQVLREQADAFHGPRLTGFGFPDEYALITKVNILPDQPQRFLSAAALTAERQHDRLDMRGIGANQAVALALGEPSQADVLELNAGKPRRLDLPLGAGVIDRRLQCRAISTDCRRSKI